MRHGNGCEDAAELRRRRLGRGDGRRGARDRLPGDGREARRRAERERGGHQAGREGGARCAAEVGGALRLGPREGLPRHRRPDRGAQGGLRARALARAGQAVHGRGDPGHRGDRGELPHRRRGREADGDRRHPLAGREQAHPHLPQAERRLRGHHAVELPHADPGRADRARHRCREFDRHEAVRVDADRHGELHADHGRRRSSRRRHQRRLWRRQGRRAAHPGRERRLRRLRRLAHDRGEDRPRCRAQALADRGERERAGGRLRRRRPRGGREGRGLRRLLLRRPGLLRDGTRARRQARARRLPRRGHQGGRGLEARRSLRRRDPRRTR